MEYIDYGTDQTAFFAAAEADEVDVMYWTTGEFVELFDQLPGWEKSEAVTAGTIVIRPNQEAEVNGMKPYADVKGCAAHWPWRWIMLFVWSWAMPVRGLWRKTTMYAIHPEYAELPKQTIDGAAAKALMDEAGMGDFEHELISIDSWESQPPMR